MSVIVGGNNKHVAYSKIIWNFEPKNMFKNIHHYWEIIFDMTGSLIIQWYVKGQIHERIDSNEAYACSKFKLTLALK